MNKIKIFTLFSNYFFALAEINFQTSSYSYLYHALIALSITTSTDNNANAIRPAWIEEASLAPINTFTDTVLNHYYTIARLRRAIALLKKTPKKLISSLSLDQLPEFTHPKIIKCINEIKKKYTFQPLFKHWQTIITYKSAGDSKYLTQYCALIFYLMAIIKNEFLSPCAEKCTPHPDSRKHSNEIAFRFFLVHRLQNIYKVLQKCENLSINTYQKTDINLTKKRAIFTDPYIYSCITKTLVCGSIRPIIYLFNLVESYQFIDNPIFIKEFLCILFITLHAIKKHNNPHHENLTVTIAEITHNYQNFFKELSIEEMLSALDRESKRIATALAGKNTSGFSSLLTYIQSIGSLISPT